MKQRGTRKIPQRTCVGCRQTKDKRELIRVVRTPSGGVEVDPTLRAPGRGAYLCKKFECLEIAKKRRALQRALEVELSDETYAALTDAIGQIEAAGD